MKISVIYITYRPGGFDMLANSFKYQTVQDYELIIIDDYEKRKPEQVKTFLEENEVYASYVGPSKEECFPELPHKVITAINTGILLSTGDVIVLMTDYTWLHKDSLERFVRCEDKLKKGCCISSICHYWGQPPQDIKLNLEGQMTIFEDLWKGSPEENRWRSPSWWIPEFWESFYSAIPWSILEKTNGPRESYQYSPCAWFERFLKDVGEVGGSFYVDKKNICEMVEHRNLKPAWLWHNAKWHPEDPSLFIDRENCFDLKSHKRGTLPK